MLSKHSNEFAVDNKVYFYTLVIWFILLSFAIFLIIINLSVNTKFIMIFYLFTLGMVFLFIRLDTRQIAYFWINPKIFRKFLLLKFKSEEVPLRFLLYHFLFYLILIIGTLIYVILYLIQSKIVIDFSLWTIWICVVLNFIPFLSFIVFELIENRLYCIHNDNS